MTHPSLDKGEQGFSWFSAAIICYLYSENDLSTCPFVYSILRTVEWAPVYNMREERSTV